MMAETLSMISIIAFVLAGICLVVTLILFIYFKIPSIIGDLSGKTARKSIEQMRQNNEKTGKKSYKTSKVNEKRGKLTDSISSINETSKTVQKSKKNEDERPETGLLDENKIRNLKKNETEFLNGNEGFDSDLDENETVPLDVYENSHKTKSDGVPIQILEEVILTESEEVVR